jgi:hypothetical protein
MKTKLLTMLTILLFGSTAFAQYCNPSYTSGTISDDYIEDFLFQSIVNYSGASATPYVTYYNAGYTPPLLYAGNTYSGSLTSGTYVLPTGQFQAFHIWVDFNGDLDFLDAGEDIGEGQTTVASQQVDF